VGDHARAVEALVAATEEAVRGGLALPEASEIEKALQRCRDSLGSADFEQAYESGRSQALASQD
jgi:hypothetical protein